MRRVDCRGMRCPWPAVRVARALRESDGVDVLEVLADDPRAGGEIAEVAAAAGWSSSGEDGIFLLRRVHP